MTPDEKKLFEGKGKLMRHIKIDLIDGILCILASIGFNISELGFLFIAKWPVYPILGSTLLSLSNFTPFRNGQW